MRYTDNLDELYNIKNIVDIKLFKIIEGEHYYWEARKVNEDQALFHYGVLGTLGKTDRIKANYPDTADTIIKRETAAKSKLGFLQLPNELYKPIIIHFRTKFFGLSTEKQRNTTEVMVNNHINRHGYGFCEVGKDNGDSYDLYCHVLDPDNAIKLIKRLLWLKRLTSYKRISKH